MGTHQAARTFDRISAPGSHCGRQHPLDIDLGLPRALLTGVLSPVLDPLNALGEVAADTIGGVTSGDLPAALTTVLEAPATIADGFIDGFLAPAWVSTDVSASLITQLNTVLAGFDLRQLPVPDGSEPALIGGVGGLVDTLVNYLPQQLADALTGQTSTEIAVNPLVFLLNSLLGGDVSSAMATDLSSILASDLSSTLAGEFGSQVPTLLTDLFALIPF